MLKEGNGRWSELYYILSIAGLRYGRIWRADSGVASKSPHWVWWGGSVGAVALLPSQLLCATKF